MRTRVWGRRPCVFTHIWTNKSWQMKPLPMKAECMNRRWKKLHVYWFFETVLLWYRCHSWLLRKSSSWKSISGIGLSTLSFSESSIIIPDIRTEKEIGQKVKNSYTHLHKIFLRTSCPIALSPKTDHRREMLLVPGASQSRMSNTGYEQYIRSISWKTLISSISMEVLFCSQFFLLKSPAMRGERVVSSRVVFFLKLSEKVPTVIPSLILVESLDSEPYDHEDQHSAFRSFLQSRSPVPLILRIILNWCKYRLWFAE